MDAGGVCGVACGEVGVGLGFGLWIVDGEGESIAELVTQKAWARRARRGDGVLASCLLVSVFNYRILPFQVLRKGLIKVGQIILVLLDPEFVVFFVSTRDGHLM